jgi:tripartite ATP-independent transporter DctM subunit
MYGVTALVSIKDLFIGGLLPGTLLVVTAILISLFLSRRVPKPTTEGESESALNTLKDSGWEILLPVIVLVSYFTGFTTLVETAALSVIYALIVEVFLRRDLKVADLPRVFLRALPVIGGVMMILTVAKGFSFYVVDAQIPTLLTELAQTLVHSRFVFLILLNLALLVTGCFMDIFSAILVVAPLVIPLGAAYGVHPVHLGIIFLANLELGYLTPPVGINLFLASYRFEEPITKVYRQVLPFALVRLVAVLLITYVPFLTIGPLRLFGGG